MPEITVTHIVLFALLTLAGAVAGWVLRANRSEQEKAAISAGWQEQIDAQRKEGERLLEQNKSLMEQVSQYQASNTDAKNRAKELSAALQEAFERRDALQREIKDIRSNLEVSLSERDRLQSDVAAREADEDLLRRKDERIEKLTKSLEGWQNRLPPLIERFRARNEEAGRLEADLAEARDRILELEAERTKPVEQETRIEPVRDPDELTDGREASNDPDEVADDEPVTSADDVSAGEDEAKAERESGKETRSDERDDLQQIKGVGPAIEKTLNELGIFRFEQIAGMSEYDIDRVARKLKGFHSRIYREDWIGQARELLGQVARA